MSEHSSMHVYLNWTKERLDEMDATLASLEAKASQQKAEAKAKADQLIADLKTRRDEFQAKAKAQAAGGEAAWLTAKTQLELLWHGFEAQVKTYFETVGKHVEQQQAAFRDIAAAQAKAWREAADKFHDAATKVAAEKRADVRCGGQADEGGSGRGRSAVAEAEAGGKRILDGAKWCVGPVAQGVRSGQPEGIGRVQACRPAENLIDSPSGHIAIDGKTLRGSRRVGSKALHVVSAFASQLSAVVGDLAVAPDENEIVAALALLKELPLEGAVVTGDAIFCQREICRTITDGHGDYLFVVKDNQPELKADIAESFGDLSPLGAQRRTRRPAA